jgi:hypothetical protein
LQEAGAATSAERLQSHAHSGLALSGTLYTAIGITAGFAANVNRPASATAAIGIKSKDSVGSSLRRFIQQTISAGHASKAATATD